MVTHLVNIEAAVVNVYSKDKKGVNPLGEEIGEREKGSPKGREPKPSKEPISRFSKIKNIAKGVFGTAIAGIGVVATNAKTAVKAVAGEAITSSRYVGSQLLEFGKFAGADGLGAVSAAFYPSNTYDSTHAVQHLHKVVWPTVENLHQNALSLTSPAALQSSITHNNTRSTSHEVNFSPQNTFSFNFNVAAGTTREQAQSMAQIIEDTVTKMQNKQHTQLLARYTNKE
ncbi:hypothetical protein BGC07_18175 [Piscirickettsia litoralis]|uniref:Uncharacterized protein n=2 Tax=Piscirickettsia litoralis TaxID=1891921 RepID=A0ABX2ZWT1_9GAMM|nr:hypothetical protein BGC07_18175 [Piscirickettsia litoralis]